MRHLRSITCLLLLFVVASAAADPITVHVILINDSRLSSLSEPQLQRVLDRTKRIIKEVCERDVEFVIDQRADSVQYFDSLAGRIAPYELSASEAIDPFAADRNAWREPIRRSLDKITDLQQIRALLPKGAPTANIDETADTLTQHYAESIDKLKALKADDSSRLLSGENWRRYNMVYWGPYLHSQDWSDQYTLYLSNTLLVDTTITAVQTTAIPCGAATNYFDMPASHAVMVAYHGIWSGDGAEVKPALARLTEDQKLDAIAYVTAQILGFDLLLGRDPEDKPGLGLGTLLKSVEDVSELSDIAKMQLQPGKPGTVRPRQSALFKILLRMDIFAAQEKWQKVLDEADRAVRLNLDDASMEQIWPRAQKAEQQLKNRENRMPVGPTG